MVCAIANDPNLVGMLVDNTYKLLDVLGSGGFGVVYRALDVTSPDHKHFAVKCMLKEPGHSAEAIAQEREWSIQSEVDGHPNIVTLHEIHMIGAYVFLVFDFCPGGDLFSAITERRVYHHNDKLIKQAFVQLIDAVAYCHSRGIAHRDIKPENVLASEDGSQVFLSDFGLATRETELSPRLRAGSMFYMSPECIGEDIEMDKYATQTSDVWSLGIILVNMISGRGLWHAAVVDDEFFSCFIHDAKFLIDVLSISEETNDLLRRLFDMNPFSRPTLDALRQEVLDMPTFYKSEGLPGSYWVSAAEEQYAHHRASPPPDDDSAHLCAVEPRIPPGLHIPIMHSVDSEEYIYGSPQINDMFRYNHRLPNNFVPIDWTPRAVHADFFPAPLDSSWSVSPSRMPITPENRSFCDADVDVMTKSLEDLSIPSFTDLDRPAGKASLRIVDVSKTPYSGPSRGYLKRDALGRLQAL